MSIDIQAEPTPNPNALKLTANQTLFEKSTSVKKGEQTEHPLAKALLEINGVDNIFGINDFVTVNKVTEVEWEDIMEEIEQAFNKVYA